MSILFPDRCYKCGASVAEPGNEFEPTPFPVFTKGFMETDLHLVFKASMKLLFCETCLADFQPVTAPFCTSCGAVFSGREGKNHMCGSCLKTPPAYTRARAAGIFEGSLMEAVHRFKYQGKLRFEQPLSALLLFCLMIYAHEFVEFGGKIDMVTPVPLHAKRFRERGFNQSFLLIRNWGKMAKLNDWTLPFLTIERHALLRNRYTSSQTGLKKEDRKKNIQGAFSLSDERDVRGKQILLVDDVYTTGATVNECARVLLKAGARRVDVLTLARRM